MRADARYERLFPLIQDEVVAGNHRDSASCTKGLLWLKRWASTPRTAPVPGAEALDTCEVH